MSDDINDNKIENSINRRSFLGMGAACAACALFKPTALKAAESGEFKPHPARHWVKLPEERVKCTLCPKECQVADKERGYCGVRENIGGKYYTLVHSRLCSAHTDPIEKKPLYHFLPGTTAFSIATAGCNMECKFCQNWEISQFRPEQINSHYINPVQVASIALREGARSIAYTYSEPVIFYEYMYDCAVEGNKRNIRSVMISNGYIQEKPMTELIDVLSGVKIDLKAFTEHFYKKYCDGELKPVLKTLELLKKKGIWFEIVVLIIPTLNDSLDENRRMAKWIKRNLGPDVPVHFSRFYPTYKIKNLPRTPVSMLEKIYSVAKEEGLNYVYVGNVPGHETGNTICPKCKKPVVKRWGYKIVEKNIDSAGRCKFCKTPIPGVWS
jgi:pyruvate formate lyase activating enzyme